MEQFHKLTIEHRQVKLDGVPLKGVHSYVLEDSADGLPQLTLVLTVDTEIYLET